MRHAGGQTRAKREQMTLLLVEQLTGIIDQYFQYFILVLDESFVGQVLKTNGMDVMEFAQDKNG